MVEFIKGSLYGPDLLELSESETGIHRDSEEAKREDTVFAGSKVEHRATLGPDEYEDQYREPVEGDHQDCAPPRSLEQRSGIIGVLVVAATAAVRYAGDVVEQQLSNGANSKHVDTLFPWRAK